MHSIRQAIIGSRAIPWLLLAATLATAGLASLRPQPPAPSPSPEMRRLAARVEDRAREYVEGLEVIVRGDPVMGGNLLASATDRMSVLADECRRIDGCDVRIFARALAALGTEEQGRAMPFPSAAARGGGAGRRAAIPADAAAPARQAVDLERAMPLNAPVKRALRDWLTWKRPQLAEAYDQYLFLRTEIAPIYERADLPEALLFGLLAQETGGKVHAYSSAGAAGPLQFMPVTARRFGLEPVSGFDMRLDPIAATSASAAYVKALLDRFGNDLPKALAAYNLGENRLASLLRPLGKVSFWDPKLSASMPTETREYVPGVLAAAWIFANASDYELVSAVPELGATVVALTEPVSIGELTMCLGPAMNPRGWFRTLRNLNPRRSGSDRIPAGETIRMPSMLVPAFVRQCAANSPRLVRARALHDGSNEAGRALEYALQRDD